MRLPIGVPRIYDGPGIPVLYPGERATCAGIPFARIVDELFERGEVTIQPGQWVVEPEPGWRGLLRRWRYRLVGQWIEFLRARRRYDV